MSVLSKSELEEPRTAAAMLPWVRSTAARLSETPELRREARRGKGFAKQLWDEALPIALFAERFYNSSPRVTIRHVIGNQRYDAEVEDRRPVPAPVKYLEVTTTLADHQESMRLELLSRDGYAPGAGPVYRQKDGDERGRIVAEDETDGQVIVNARLQKLVEVVKKKRDKWEGPDGAALIVAFSDSSPFNSDYYLQLQAVVQDTLVPMLHGGRFSCLVVQGATGLVHIVAWVPAAGIEGVP